VRVIHDAIRYPVTTTVGVLLVFLFGFISLWRIPLELTPNVEEPKVTVSTFWPGASPHEIEREIVEEQEEQLKSLEGLTKMESSSSDSFGQITLTFQIGTSLDGALLRVANRLEQVPSYPEDVEKPVIRSVDLGANAIAWFILMADESGRYPGDVTTEYDFVDDYLKPAFERVPGVAASNVFGGTPHEMQVIVDPAALAARRITLNQIGAALERENRSYSGGDFDEGKRRYIVRTVGEYASPEEIANVVVAVRNNVPIYVRDVARVQLGFRKRFAQGYYKGTPIIAMNAVKEPGANTLEVMRQLKAAVAGLNRSLLAPRGLQLKQVYDETVYIHSALDLVRSSLLLGALLAVLVLMLFLRSATATLVIAVSIPISLVGTFIIMDVLGRTLNVISLAGLAFASGMVVDNSIVVLENIYRHRQMGKSRFNAAFDGAREVWGAVLASTLTTIAVFLPVLFVREEAGQLFRDIALAISCSVGLSLLVSITVIPSLSAKVLRAAAGSSRAESRGETERRGFHNLWGWLGAGERFRRRVQDAAAWVCATNRRQLATVLGFTAASIGLSFLLLPKAEYLPLGNRNLLFGIILPPPGYNLDEVSTARDLYQAELSPLWRYPVGSPEAEKLPGGGIDNFFFVALPTNAFIGASAGDPMRVRELIPEFGRANQKIPGAIAFVAQSSLFQRGVGEGRNIDIQITGPELEELVALGGEIFGQVLQRFPGAQARPIPSLDLGNPEVRVLTHRRRSAELGISNRDLGFTVSALVDGAKASDYQWQGKEIDLKVMAGESFAHRTHLLEQMPIATPDGRLVTLGSVADIAVINGPVQINHRERQRTITIQMTPPEKMALQTAMEKIEAEIFEPLRRQGRIGGLYRVHLTGSADKLAQAGRALRFNFILASVITYLLMASLFESFLYPFVIMFSVPLGAVGGFLGLWLVNALIAYQAMDVVTMLGFIILVGTVVNNAILIVHQSLNHMRAEGLAPLEAIREAVGNRVRPIFMTTGTTAFGMLPLVVAPGAGSELYRGLGAIIIGGLTVSTVFTLLVVPAVFSLMLSAKESLADYWPGRLAPGPADDD
jgi:HAE1 family hydrophobic/amphiphilic exporter-1